mmetsp:Transcript_57788/g.118269  ORF Transcript_57788/g.118269 Transcript_57788/m.118269 type:complete len:267 (-) Transcript_57788:77-877(-)
MEKDRVVRLTTPGVGLALSFAECLVAGGDSYGLLFGAIEEKVVSTVTDSGTKEVTKVNIDVQVYRQLRFFGAYGKVEEEVFAEAVESHPQQLIGWFVFRANTPMRVSVKEHSVHAQLEVLAASLETNGQCSAPLLFGMLTNSATTNNSTQSMDYRFVSRAGEKLPFTSMELNITNPEHKSQAEYGEFSAFSRLAQKSEDVDQRVVSFTDIPSQELQVLHSFADGQQKRLNDLIEELELADVEELKLAAELEALQTEHASLQAKNVA